MNELARLVSVERERRGLSRSVVARRSRGAVSGPDLRSIESGDWTSPPAELLTGIAQGMEPRDTLARGALRVELFLAVGLLTAADIEAWRAAA